MQECLIVITGRPHLCGEYVENDQRDQHDCVSWKPLWIYVLEHPAATLENIMSFMDFCHRSKGSIPKYSLAPLFERVLQAY